jgi:hypothetical protein
MSAKLLDDVAAASLSVRPTEPRPADRFVTTPVSWASECREESLCIVFSLVVP